MERSVNTDPGSRVLPEPLNLARVGLAMVCAATNSLLALDGAREAEAD